MNLFRFGHAATTILLLARLQSIAHESPDSDLMLHAVRTAQTQITQATDALNAQRDRIVEERKPLVTEIEALRLETERLREDAHRRRSASTQDDAARAALAREISQLQNTFDFHFTLLQEYRRSFETRQSIAASQHVRKRFADIDNQLQASHQPAMFIAAASGLLMLAETWNLQKFGGTIIQGTCMASDGTLMEGDFAIMGPSAFFAARSNELAGLVIHRLGSSMPSLWEGAAIPSPHAITEVLAGHLVDLPVDTSGGNALRVSAQKKSLRDHLVAGGAIMVPLLIIGIIAALLTLLKWIELSRVKTPDEGLLARVADHLRANAIAKAQDLIDQLSPPFRDVFSAGIEYRGVPDTHLEEILQERALGVIPSLDRHLGMIAVLGGVAPLLGLLGTVTGMIHTFELVTIFGTGDARLLSGGISEALVTTETGLIIAVPILIIHALLTRRVRTLVAALEQTVVGFMNRMHQRERVIA